MLETSVPETPSSVVQETLLCHNLLRQIFLQILPYSDSALNLKIFAISPVLTNLNFNIIWYVILFEVYKILKKLIK